MVPSVGTTWPNHSQAGAQGKPGNLEKGEEGGTIGRPIQKEKKLIEHVGT